MDLFLSLSLSSAFATGFSFGDGTLPAVDPGYDFYLPDWGGLSPIDETSPTKLYTANGVSFNGVDQAGEVTTSIVQSGDFSIKWCGTFNNSQKIITGLSGNNGITLNTTSGLLFITIRIGNVNYSLTTLSTEGAGAGIHTYEFVRVGSTGKFYVNGVLSSEREVGTEDYTTDKLYNQGGSYYTGKIHYLQFSTGGVITNEYKFTEGVGATVLDSIGDNDITLTGSPTWETGLDTPFNLLTSPQNLGYNVYPRWNGLDSKITYPSKTVSDFNIKIKFDYINDGNECIIYSHSSNKILIMPRRTASGNRLVFYYNNIEVINTGMILDSGVYEIEYSLFGSSITAVVNGTVFNNSVAPISVTDTWCLGWIASNEYTLNGTIVSLEIDGVFYTPFNNWGGGTPSGTFGTTSSNETSVGSGVDGYGQLIRGFNRYTDNTGTTPDPNGAYIAYETCE